MSLIITTQPVAEPVSLSEMKLHLRVDHTTDDELIKSLIKAARQWCEMYERRAYMLRTYQLKLDWFYDDLELDFPPLISVGSITYTDTSGTTQTLASTVYDVVTEPTPGGVRLAYGQSWPTPRDDEDVVTINYTAGFSTTFTTAYATDILTVGNAIFADGDIVVVESDAGDLPSGLSVGTNYYVRDVSGSTLKLAATSGGTAIDLADDGTGTHYIALASTGLVPAAVKAAIKLLVGHLYENRENSTEINLNSIPFGVKSLLFERMF